MTMAVKAEPGSTHGLGHLHPLVFPIAGFGLSGMSGPPVDVEDGSWRMLLSDLKIQRLTGFAVEAVQAGWLNVAAEQWEQLVDAQRALMCQVLQIEGALVVIDEACRKAGIEYVVLKGPSLAHSSFEDPCLRPFGDLDLLVHTEDWDRASQILATAGFKPAHPEAREGFHASFGKALVHRRDDGIEVDLHRRLVVGPHGLCADPAELFSGVRSFMLGTRELPRLADTWMFLHVCMHAALGSRVPILMAVRDVQEVAGMTGIDWPLVTERVNRWKLRAVILYALELGSDLLGGQPPEACLAVCDRLTPSTRERKWLEAYTTDRRGRGGTAVAAISAIPGIRAKARYISALLLPQREFLESRPRASYLSRWALPLRWLVRRRRG